jgi:hypothetical protein
LQAIRRAAGVCSFNPLPLSVKNPQKGWGQGLGPAIPDTGEVDIRKIRFEARLSKKLKRSHLSKQAGCGGSPL